MGAAHHRGHRADRLRPRRAEPAHPDRLSLQYWFYYPFNDWNNLHEGDWEMIQLVFPAGSAEEALGHGAARDRLQPARGRRAGGVGDEKLELVDGTHPVVYPAAGSHANFYSPTASTWDARPSRESAATTRPARTRSSAAGALDPERPRAAQAAFPWIAFEGRWGERQKAFYNGPTGPNLKTQWTEPITWAEDWRDRSYAVPAGGAFGTDATDFFCGAVEAGSNFVLRAVDNGGRLALVLGVLAAALIFLLTRTSWRPSTPLRARRRRSWGQTFTASWRLYRMRPLLFLGIGLVVIPISLVITGLQILLFSATSLVGIDPNGEGGGFRVPLAGVDRDGPDAPPSASCKPRAPARSPRSTRRRSASARLSPRARQRLGLLGALAIAVAVVTVLSVSIFLVPIAIWLAVRWALIVPVVELEEQSGLGGSAPERAARPPAVVQGGHPRCRRGGAGDPCGPVPGGPPHPARRCSIRVRQRARGPRLRSGDAVRRHHDDLCLLRHACPRAPGRGGRCAQ